MYSIEQTTKVMQNKTVHATCISLLKQIHLLPVDSVLPLLREYKMTVITVSGIKLYLVIFYVDAARITRLLYNNNNKNYTCFYPIVSS